MLLLLHAPQKPGVQDWARELIYGPGRPACPSLMGRGGPDLHRRPPQDGVWSTPSAWAGQCWSPRATPAGTCTTSILPRRGGTSSGGTLARAVPGHGPHWVWLPCWGGGTTAGGPGPRVPKPVPDLAPGPSKRVSFANKLRPAASACQVRARLAGLSRWDRDAQGAGSSPGTEGPQCCPPCPGLRCPVALKWARTGCPLLAGCAGSRQGRAEPGQRLALVIRRCAGRPGSLAGQDGALPCCWGAAAVPAVTRCPQPPRRGHGAMSIPCRIPWCHRSC